MNISKPVNRGIITDWDSLEHIWNYSYLEGIKVDSSSHPILYALSPLASSVAKERIMLIFFETFGVEGFYCCPNPVLSMYATGRTTGGIIDSGDEVTTVSLIKNGDIVP